MFLKIDPRNLNFYHDILMKRIFFLLPLLALVLLLPPVRAQQEREESPIATVPAPSTAFREPSLWGRLFGKPACATPAEQLALAERLEREGRSKAARKAYEALYLAWPLAPEAPVAVYRLAERRAAEGKFEAAFQELQYLLTRYGSRWPDLDGLLRRQMALADAIAQARSAPWLLGGFPKREAAIPLYSQVASNAPRSSLAFEASLKAAELLELERQYEPAIALYFNVMASHPTKSQQADIPFRILRAEVALCRRYPHDLNQAETAREEALRYLREHPGSPNEGWIRETLVWLERRLAAGLLDRARVYERAGRSALARRLYEQCQHLYAGTPEAETARRRLEKLPRSSEEPRS